MTPQEFKSVIDKATPGKWKLWGMQVRADQDGSSEVTRCPLVAYTEDEREWRTWNAESIALTHNLAPALLELWEAAKALPIPSPNTIIPDYRGLWVNFINALSDLAEAK